MRKCIEGTRTTGHEGVFGNMGFLSPRLCRVRALPRLLLAFALLLPATSIFAHAAETAPVFGPFGPESPRMREQLWVMPGGAPDAALRVTVFRPSRALERTPRPVVIINHGTSEAARLAQAMPVFYWLSRWFVERGYVVVLPERRGHGATGGPLVETSGSCADPDHFRSGQLAADDIEAVVRYVRQQSFVDPESVLVAGISTGGWASLALASRNTPGVRAIVNFAGGRGGHAGGRANAVCSAQRLVQAAGTFGKTARIPTLWLYAKNDSYFAPDLAGRMATAFNTAGGSAELHVLPPYEDDGHRIADDQDGWDIWGDIVETFIGETMTAPAAHVASGKPNTVLTTGSIERGNGGANAIGATNGPSAATLPSGSRN